MSQFRFTPGEYLELMHAEIERFDELQEEVARATEGLVAAAILELGVGTGETARRVLERHPGARFVGIDASEEMLAAAREALPGADLRVGRLEDELPHGPFDLVVSCLVVHHLDGAGKRDLFQRVAAVLSPHGRLVLGDVVVPERPEDAATPLTPEFDLPDRTDDQLRWLEEAGLRAHVEWSWKDLAVMRGDAGRGVA